MRIQSRQVFAAAANDDAGWSDYLDTLRAQIDITIPHHVGEQAALTAMEAFQHADSQRALSFQTQAMEALHAIVLLSKRY
jgi:Tfp pilus assembly protein PilN